MAPRSWEQRRLDEYVERCRVVENMSSLLPHLLRHVWIGAEVCFAGTCTAQLMASRWTSLCCTLPLQPYWVQQACDGRLPSTPQLPARRREVKGIMLQPTRVRSSPLCGRETSVQAQLVEATKQLDANTRSNIRGLDALAHHWRLSGVPAGSVQWGPWLEVGMAAAGLVALSWYHGCNIPL